MPFLIAFAEVEVVALKKKKKLVSLVIVNKLVESYLLIDMDGKIGVEVSERLHCVKVPSP